jgi:predicted signal transduction protein with EAL and GGDEF domain
MHQSRFPTPEGRKVDLRTAAFDYFLNETDLLTEPMVMERAELRQTELMAYFDYLTGLRNYAYFESEIKTEVARAKRYQTSLCLLLCDLDGFKYVNDSLGHRTGTRPPRSGADPPEEASLERPHRPVRRGRFAVLLHRTDPRTDLGSPTICASIDAQFESAPSGGFRARSRASFGLSSLQTRRTTSPALRARGPRALPGQTGRR